MTAFAKNLRRIRETRGWSATYVAKRLGLAQNTVSNYENGAREPNLTTFKRLANLLGVSSDELLEGVADESLVVRQSEKTPWEMSGFSVVDVDDQFIRIEPSAELIDEQECVPIELPKAKFLQLTKTMLEEARVRYPADQALANQQFAIWAMTMTGRKATLRRLDPFKVIGAFVPVDCLPRAFRPSADRRSATA